MADSSEELPEITITIKAPSDSKQTVTISPSKTVLELKQKVAEASGVEVDRQRLIYSGKVLKDEEILSVYKIQNNHSIHLVKGASKNPSTSTSTSTPSTSSPSTSSNPSAANRGIPSNFAAGLPVVNDPLAQLEGMRGHGMGGGTFNPFAGMPGGENLMGDPNAMANMMNNPEMISAAMAQLSPEMIDTVIASNPQLQAMGPQVRQMMTSPMFRQMMSDPQMVRQMMDMQRGMGGMGGAGGSSAASPFPAPGGGTPSTAATTAGTGATGAAATPANPFAAMMGGGNPFGGFGGAGAGAGGGAGGANPFGMTPEMMQQMQQMMGGGGAGGGGFGGFGGMGGYGGAPAAPALPADTRSIEERFQSQLLQLNEMGLCDPQQNIRALTMTGGNVQAAIELIFSGSVPAGTQ